MYAIIPEGFIPPAPTHDSDIAREVRNLVPLATGGLQASYCLRCGFPLANPFRAPTPPYVQAHTHELNSDQLVAALCHSCWEVLGGAEARVEYYVTMLDVQDILSIGWDPHLKRQLMQQVANEQ